MLNNWADVFALKTNYKYSQNAPDGTDLNINFKTISWEGGMPPDPRVNLPPPLLALGRAGVIKIIVRAIQSPVDSGHLVFKVRAAGNESL